MFFHAGGAINKDGIVQGVNVRLPGALSRFLLPAPPAGDDLTSAVKASLRLAHLGPVSICFPLLAGTFRAVLGDADFLCIWLVPPAHSRAKLPPFSSSSLDAR